MGIAGRINVDVLFHDTEGTTSLKVVSLEDSTAYTTGKVAVVTGTVGTSNVQLWSSGSGIGFGGYRDAAGQLVTLNSVTRIAMRASSQSGTAIEDADLGVVELMSIGNRVAVGDNIGNTLNIRCFDGTSSFTAVLYGT